MGSIRKRRKTKESLGTVYLKYLTAMTGMILAGAAVFITVLLVLVNTGELLSADYAEREIQEKAPLLAQADSITAENIPLLCTYAVFDTEGSLLETDMPQKGVDMAKKIIAGKNPSSYIYFYKVIERTDGFCVLRYRVTPQYRSAFLRKYLIAPQALFILAGLFYMLAVIVLFSMRFGRKIKRKMNPLLELTEKIKAQELSGEVAYSGITEIDEVIVSMDEMRQALEDSLKAQWAAKQEKSRQISALAHDIRTPLTVAYGNAQLLAELPQTQEQKECTAYITDSCAKIQDYVNVLIETVKTADKGTSEDDSGDSFILTEKLVSEIKRQSMGLASAKRQHIRWEEHRRGETLCVDFRQAVRAVMNVVDNAARYTPQGGTIRITVSEESEKLYFIIEDTGSGFSKNARHHGTEYLFTDDESRGGQHYGIGLFITNNIVQKYGGTVNISDSVSLGGAKVTVSFGLNGKN